MHENEISHYSSVVLSRAPSLSPAGKADIEKRLRKWGQARYGVRPNPESESNTQRAAASGCNHHNVSAEVAVALIFSFI